MSLLGAEEMAALSETAEALFDSVVEIFRQTNSSAGDAWDDSTEIAIEDGATPDDVVMGWFRNQPDDQISGELGAIAHEDDGRLFVPLGTVLRRSDEVVIYAADADGNKVGDGTAFRVIDTNLQNTHRVLVRAALKRID